MSDKKIMSGDVYVTEFGAIIRTNCPVDLITDAMVHERVVAANLAAGDYIRVQSFNHEKTCILHYAEYLVYDRRPEIKRVELSDRETRTREEISFSVLRVQDWRATPAGEGSTAKTSDADECNAPASTELTIKWNVAEKAHQVIDGLDNVHASFTKEQGGREAAEAFVNQPQTVAA